MKQMRRIVNGEIPAKAVPWQVNLLYKSKSICGGVLIDQTTILTAGHCTWKYKEREHDFNPSNYKLIFGSKYRNPQRDDLVITPSEVMKYPLYSKPFPNNDLALIKLPWKHRITYNYDIQPICLPHEDYLSIHDNFYQPPNDTKWYDDDCYISGFGSTKKSI